MMSDFEVGQCPVVHPTFKIKIKLKTIMIDKLKKNLFSYK